MGASPSKGDHLYAAPISTPTENESAVYRQAATKDALLYGFSEKECQNGWEIFLTGHDVDPSSPFLGTRVKKPDGTLGEYNWLSYSDVKEKALNLGSALLDVIKPDRFEEENTDYSFLGIFSKNRYEWMVCEQAANAYSFTLVPLYDTLGVPALSFILTQTKLQTVAVAPETYTMLINVMKTMKESGEETKVKTVLIFSPRNDDYIKQAEDYNLNVLFWEETLASGAKDRKAIISPKGSVINTVCYTSGTTGHPKGAKLSHSMFVAAIASVCRTPFSRPDSCLGRDDIHISYLPLAHVFERICSNVILFAGGRIGFYNGDPLKLVDDLQFLAPTVFVSVPRVFNKIHAKIQEGLESKPTILRTLFEKALAYKLQKFQTTGSYTSCCYDTLVFRNIRNLLGGRIRLFISGSAPLNPKVHADLRAMFSIPVIQGYGLTESMGGTIVQNAADRSCGTIGGIIDCLEFKVQSIPEMDYFSNPKTHTEENPNMLPRGELCLRGAALCPGYFCDKAATQALYPTDSWLSTGDVAEVLPDGGLRIIDRKKNIFKLAQGEYIIPDKIEDVYARASLVSQIFVYGDSSESFLIAVIVMDAAKAKTWNEANNGTKNVDELCKDPSFIAAVAQELKSVEKDLKGFEKVKKFHLTLEPFSVENDLLTATFKLRRPAAKKFYEAELDRLYAAGL